MFPQVSHFLALILWPPHPVLFANQPELSGLNFRTILPIAIPHVNLLLPHNAQEFPA
jgi:hypothetical protein